jgi:hypothetical protein
MNTQESYFFPYIEEETLNLLGDPCRSAAALGGGCHYCWRDIRTG